MRAGVETRAWLPTFLFICFRIFAATTCLAHASSHGPAHASSDIVPGAYFVRFKDNDAVRQGGPRTRAVDGTLHTAFESFLHQQNVKFTPRVKLTSAQLISGMSIQTNHPDAHAVLSSFHGADAVFPVRRISMRNDDDFATPSTLLKRDSSSAANDPQASGLAPPLSGPYGPHVNAGIDKIHAAGNFGQGITIGLIDSGVDYTHHALNGGKPDGTPCFGPGCLVVDGISFVGRDGNMSIVHDPYPYCTADQYEGGHGTHILGILAANDTSRGLVGGAPGVRIKAYRTMDCSGSSTDDIIAAAFERAFFDGVDIVSASIGTAIGWQDCYVNVIVSRLIDAGVMAVGAAGNQGTVGPFQSSSPAEAEGAHASGALFNPDLLGFTATAVGPAAQRDIAYLTSNPIAVKSNKLPVYVYTVNGTISDVCTLPSPGSVPDLDGHVVLLNFGHCGLAKVVTNLNALNATVGLFLNNADLKSTPYPDRIRSPSQLAVIPQEDFEWIVQSAENRSSTVFVDFSKPKNAVVKAPEGGLLTWYSSYGTDWELHKFVGTGTVGGNVLSTYPLYMGSYAVRSGTSMSAPLFTSAVALYMSAKGKKETPRELSAIFTTTAEPIKLNSSSDVLETVAHQGGGRLDVARAIASTMRVWPDFHALNDTEFFNGTQTLTFTNIGSTTQQLSFSHIPAGTVYACNGSDAMQLLQSGPWVPVDADQATVSYTPSHVSVEPGQSTSITVTYAAPKVDPRQCALYSGFTEAKSDDENGSLTVPYLGFAASMRALATTVNINDPASGEFLPGVIDPVTSAPIQEGAVFNLSGTIGQPTIFYGPAVGTRLLTFDLVHANSTSTAAKRRHFQGKHSIRRAAAAAAASTRRRSGDDHANAVYARLDTSPLRPRFTGQPITYTIGPTYTDAQNVTRTIDDGDYRVLIRQLKLRGDPDNEDDYVPYLSPSFSIKKA